MNPNDAFIRMFVRYSYSIDAAVELETRIKKDLPNEVQLFKKLEPLLENGYEYPSEFFRKAVDDLTYGERNGVKGVLFPYLYSLRKAQKDPTDFDGPNAFFMLFLSDILHRELSQHM